MMVRAFLILVAAGFITLSGCEKSDSRATSAPGPKSEIGKTIHGVKKLANTELERDKEVRRQLDDLPEP